MNLIKKIYCRAFQQAFHIAIPLLPYRCPKQLGQMQELVRLLVNLNGAGRLSRPAPRAGRMLQSSKLPYAALRTKRRTSVLLVTDAAIRGQGITQHLEELLRQQEIQCVVYDKTVANPTSDNVEEALALYQEHGCQALIGFGGGSSIDCAKAVGARVACPKKQLSDMEGILKIRRRLPLLIAIPTTAGTGSETTLTTVITDAETRHKYPINDFPLIPRYAVLDPEVTRTLPPHLTATTGMDALTHAVEAYIGRSTTAATRKCAVKAVRLIFQNIRKAYADGGNMKARKRMLYASYLAGNAFSRSYVGYVHAVAHSLGGKYDVPHGLANAVLLPFVLEAYGADAWKPLHRLAMVTGLSDAAESHEAGAKKFIQAIRDMKRDLNIGDTIPEIREEDILMLAKKAEREANPLYPVPRLMDARELQKFYYDVMEDAK